MSNAKTAPKWQTFKNLDIGELNQLNADVFKARYEDGQSLHVSLSHVFSEFYGFDTSTGTGPYAAVVLDVLNGPQIKNQATTGGRVNTTTLNLDSYPFPLWDRKDDGGSKNPVVVKARIPEFDADIDWPEDKEDKARIDIHGEYYQFQDDPDLEKVEVGDVVWVSYDNNYAGVSLNGRPAGKLVGVYKKAAKKLEDIIVSARASLDPECKKERLNGHPGGFYVGETDPNPNEYLKPAIRKIKANIKTGVYGNGTPETKAHFVQALNKSVTSPEFSLSGPAPGATNSFIWIGGLRDNGYMDVLDRPNTIGRETIIYAPMTLDRNAPIEIIYYFHDDAGFGHAHILGPYTTVANAITNADLSGNDFREKIAPAIKDLNRQGRNYVLVIPELSFSRGYGTGSKDKDRVKKLQEGSAVQPSTNVETTLRSRTDPSVRGAVKNYLKNIRLQSAKSILHVTPLREREFSNFDGSFTGGLFSNFHEQVLEVLDDHLGQINDEVIHFVAEGLGAISLCSIVSDFQGSTLHGEARSSFRNAFPGKRLRFDLILDSQKEKYYETNYGYFFGVYQITANGLTTTETNSPSLAFYQNFITLMASDPGYGHVELNYIATVKGETITNKMFRFLTKENDYLDAVKSAPSAALGFKKFTFRVNEIFPNTATNPEVYISLHTSPEDTQQLKSAALYSLTNTFVMPSGNTIRHPKKPDASSELQPSFSEVPNHMYALSTTPSSGDLAKIAVLQKRIDLSIKYFEKIIGAIDFSINEEGVFVEDELCDMLIDGKPTSRYCVDGELKLGKDSNFNSDYLDYLKNKKEYMQLEILAENELRILNNINNKDQLIIHRNDVDKQQLENSIVVEDAIALWDSFHVNIRNLFQLYSQASEAAAEGQGPSVGELLNYVEIIADTVCRKEAYEKIKSKINSAIKNIDPQQVRTNRPFDCGPQPSTIGGARLAGSIYNQPIPESRNNCSEVGSFTTPGNTNELYNLIFKGIEEAERYKPKKSDFSFEGDGSSKTPTKISDVSKFQVRPFEYKARSTKGNTTHVSDGPKVWACLGSKLTNAFKVAGDTSLYYPIHVFKGITGCQKPPTKGVTAYNIGMSLHAFGLAFDLDPGITGYSDSPDEPVSSVFTGAWGFPGLEREKVRQRLYELGVYKINAKTINDNMFQEPNRLRLIENWKAAPSAYKKNEQKYNKYMTKAKGAPIVPAGSNPILWVLTFCERSGMKWGNGTFLKKKFRNGSTWNQRERKEISNLFGIPNIIERVQSISWNSNIDDHMHFQYWNGPTQLIKWQKDGTL